MKVYGYIGGIPSAETKENWEICHQKNIEEFCRFRNHDIVHTYLDTVEVLHSFLAPKFQLMIKDMLFKNVKTVVVNSLESLSSESPIKDQIVYYLAAKKINLITVNNGKVITRSIRNNYLKNEMIKLQGLFSELDNSIKMINLRKSREKIRRKTGKCEGRKSYLEIAPDIIKEIKKLRRRRKGLKTRTFADIAQQLNDSGYVTASGGEFTGNNVSVILHRLKAA